MNINKPSGISSSLAVSKVRRALGERKIGHMGTLDPMGEGVLLMGVGKCTRLFDYFLGKTKTYEAAFRFGFSTDTLDITGKTIAQTIDIPTMTDIVLKNAKICFFCAKNLVYSSSSSVSGKFALW